MSAVALVAVVGTLSGLPADAGSLPAVGSGQRPGPDLLYARAPRAPQLENTGVWRAKPILVSGATAYRGGEFLYQDYLYDDHGATGVDDPTDPFEPPANGFSPKHGTLTYPTDTATFANNAADLVELRVKPLADATAFRVTLNTMKAPQRVAFTIALGNSTTPVAWPHGAGVSSPARLFLTAHGSAAELVTASGKVRRPAPTVSVDRTRRQVQVRVPHSAWNPRTSTVRMAAGVGLWDPKTGGYLTPAAAATGTQPGGASTSGAALFNMAFRTNEPLPMISEPGVANTTAEGAAGVRLDGTWWRERQQGDLLAAGDVSRFAARVDFGKLAAGVRDNSGVPRTGHLNRIFPSRFVFGQGVDYDVVCVNDFGNYMIMNAPVTECTGRQVGQLQPYALYVPDKPVPSRGFGLVITMHGLSANHNEFLGSNEVEQFGDRGTGAIVASPEGRGPDGGYRSYAEADVFEMWADVARHYRLDARLTDITGYSMGGIGSYRLASRWPDLFARAFPIVGPPVPAPDAWRSLRNVPVMAWYGQTDELVGPEMSERAYLSAQQAGLRYDYWSFVPAGHITLGNNDEYAPAAAFFGDHRVNRNPAHVTYYVDPAQDSRALSPANHAYWASRLTLRAADAPGLIDLRSHAFGRGDPAVLPVELSAGTLDGGSHGPLPYTRRTLTWGPTPRHAKADVLDVRATNVSAVTIDARRAGLSCHPKINILGDPITVHIVC